MLHVERSVSRQALLIDCCAHFTLYSSWPFQVAVSLNLYLSDLNIQTMDFGDDDFDTGAAHADDQGDDDNEEQGPGSSSSSIRTYSLAPPSACTALCVLSELLYQRGFDIVKIGDAAYAPGVTYNDVVSTAAEESAPVLLPRIEILDGADGTSPSHILRCAPAPRPLNDRHPVEFPDNVKWARSALRALGDKGIMARTLRLPYEPMVIAQVPVDVSANTTAYIQEAKPGDQILVYAPCGEPKVLVKTTRSIVEHIVHTKENLAKSGNCLHEAIIVHSGHVLPYARKELSIAKHDDGHLIHDFGVYELQANLTSHALVPLHVPVSEEHVRAHMSKLGVLAHKVPVMFEDDAVAKAFGLRPGNYVKIRRHGYEGASEIAFRRVVHKLSRAKDKRAEGK